MLKKDLERQVFDLRNLLEISKSLSSTLDYHILNDSILYTCLGALTVFKAAFFSKKNLDSIEFSLHRSFLGFELEHGAAYTIPEAGPLVSYLSEHGGCHDPRDLARALPWAPETKVLERIDPRILVPLKAKGAVNGILVLGEKIGGEAFDARDREYLETLAGLAAIAVHNAYLFELTTTDLMTRLKLKHFFLNSLQERLASLAKSEFPLSLVLFDIDHFKAVNDTLGHLAGDETLKGVAAIIRDAVRMGDLAARYGGEEFIVLLSGADQQKANDVAERIRRRVARAAFASRGQTSRVTISAGVAVYDPNRDDSPLGLIDRADRALYLSKQNGRNQVTVAG